MNGVALEISASYHLHKLNYYQDMQAAINEPDHLDQEN